MKKNYGGSAVTLCKINGQFLYSYANDDLYSFILASSGNTGKATSGSDELLRGHENVSMSFNEATAALLGRKKWTRCTTTRRRIRPKSKNIILLCLIQLFCQVHLREHVQYI